MQSRDLGQSQISASVIGLGCWAMGGWMWGGTSEKDSIDAIHAAIDSGITLIDTAPIYGFGLSEDIVGKAIEGKRDRIVLATKCGLVCNTTEGIHRFNSNASTFDPNGHIGIYGLLSPDSIRKEVEGSLKRLHTDYIDLYQTHWQESTTSIQDTMQALMDLKNEGKIRAIGVSNASVEQMQEYQEVGPLDTDQEKYSMLTRKLDEQQLPFCQMHKIAMLAYSPMEKGLLTGKMGPEREFEENDQRKTDKRFSVENRKKVGDMLEKFEEIREEHGISQAQLTIAWTFHQPGVTHALCGARRVEQSKENAAAGAVQLSEEEVQQINQIIAEYRNSIE